MTTEYFIKTIEVEPGIEVNLKREMPYGHIHLSLNQGYLPEKYQDSAYTTIEAAERAVNAYKEDRKMELSKLLKEAPSLSPSETTKKVRKVA